jgi:hypothetical protein
MSADKIGARSTWREKPYSTCGSPRLNQVEHNRESQVLQDAMHERLVQLGGRRSSSSMKTLGARQRAGLRASTSIAEI